MKIFLLYVCVVKVLVNCVKYTVLDITGKNDVEAFKTENKKNNNTGIWHSILTREYRVIRVVDDKTILWRRRNNLERFHDCVLTKHNGKPRLMMFSIQYFNDYFTINRFRNFLGVWLPYSKRMYKAYERYICNFHGDVVDMDIDIIKEHSSPKLTMTRYWCGRFLKCRLTPKTGFRIKSVSYGVIKVWERNDIQEEVIEVHLHLEIYKLVGFYLVYETYYGTADTIYFRCIPDVRKISRAEFIGEADPPGTICPCSFQDEVVPDSQGSDEDNDLNDQPQQTNDSDPSVQTNEESNRNIRLFSYVRPSSMGLVKVPYTVFINHSNKEEEKEDEVDEITEPPKPVRRVLYTRISNTKKTKKESPPVKETPKTKSTTSRRGRPKKTSSNGKGTDIPVIQIDSDGDSDKRNNSSTGNEIDTQTENGTDESTNKRSTKKGTKRTKTSDSSTGQSVRRRKSRAKVDNSSDFGDVVPITTYKPITAPQPHPTLDVSKALQTDIYRPDTAADSPIQYPNTLYPPPTPSTPLSHVINEHQLSPRPITPIQSRSEEMQMAEDMSTIFKRKTYEQQKSVPPMSPVIQIMPKKPLPSAIPLIELTTTRTKPPQQQESNKTNAERPQTTKTQIVDQINSGSKQSQQSRDVIDLEPPMEIQLIPHVNSDSGMLRTLVISETSNLHVPEIVETLSASTKRKLQETIEAKMREKASDANKKSTSTENAEGTERQRPKVTTRVHTRRRPPESISTKWRDKKSEASKKSNDSESNNRVATTEHNTTTSYQPNPSIHKDKIQTPPNPFVQEYYGPQPQIQPNIQSQWGIPQNPEQIMYQQEQYQTTTNRYEHQEPYQTSSMHCTGEQSIGIGIDNTNVQQQLQQETGHIGQTHGQQAQSQYEMGYNQPQQQPGYIQSQEQMYQQQPSQTPFVTTPQEQIFCTPPRAPRQMGQQFYGMEQQQINPMDYNYQQQQMGYGYQGHQNIDYGQQQLSTSFQQSQHFQEQTYPQDQSQQSFNTRWQMSQSQPNPHQYQQTESYIQHPTQDNHHIDMGYNQQPSYNGQDLYQGQTQQWQSQPMGCTDNQQNMYLPDISTQSEQHQISPWYQTQNQQTHEMGCNENQHQSQQSQQIQGYQQMPYIDDIYQPFNNQQSQYQPQQEQLGYHGEQNQTINVSQNPQLGYIELQPHPPNYQPRYDLSDQQHINQTQIHAEIAPSDLLNEYQPQQQSGYIQGQEQIYPGQQISYTQMETATDQRQATQTQFGATPQEQRSYTELQTTTGGHTDLEQQIEDRPSCSYSYQQQSTTHDEFSYPIDQTPGSDTSNSSRTLSCQGDIDHFHDHVSNSETTHSAGAHLYEGEIETFRCEQTGGEDGNDNSGRLTPMSDRVLVPIEQTPVNSPSPIDIIQGPPTPPGSIMDFSEVFRNPISPTHHNTFDTLEPSVSLPPPLDEFETLNRLFPQNRADPDRVRVMLSNSDSSGDEDDEFSTKIDSLEQTPRLPRVKVSSTFIPEREGICSDEEKRNRRSRRRTDTEGPEKRKPGTSARTRPRIIFEIPPSKYGSIQISSTSLNSPTNEVNMGNKGCSIEEQDDIKVDTDDEDIAEILRAMPLNWAGKELEIPEDKNKDNLISDKSEQEDLAKIENNIIESAKKFENIVNEPSDNNKKSGVSNISKEIQSSKEKEVTTDIQSSKEKENSKDKDISKDNQIEKDKVVSNVNQSSKDNEVTTDKDDSLDNETSTDNQIVICDDSLDDYLYRKRGRPRKYIQNPKVLLPVVIDGSESSEDGDGGFTLDLLELDDASPFYSLDLSWLMDVPIFRMIPGDKEYIREIVIGDLLVWEEDEYECTSVRAVVIESRFKLIEIGLLQKNGTVFMYFTYAHGYYGRILRPDFYKEIYEHASERERLHKLRNKLEREIMLDREAEAFAKKTRRPRRRRKKVNPNKCEDVCESDHDSTDDEERIENKNEQELPEAWDRGGFLVIEKGMHTDLTCGPRLIYPGEDSNLGKRIRTESGAGI